jgi:hypothetical protein
MNNAMMTFNQELRRFKQVALCLFVVIRQGDLFEEVFLNYGLLTHQTIKQATDCWAGGRLLF